MMTESIVTLPSQWVTADIFEQALRHASTTSCSNDTRITFHIPPNCKIMVDAAVRLLSLANQQVAEGGYVLFAFGGEQNDAMSYLNRANFFSLLSEQVNILPNRPDLTYAQRYLGNSKNLVEFRSISSTDYERSDPIVTQLADALEIATAARPDSRQLGRTAFTIFGELINNVYSHSQTVLDGFAALQVYSQGGTVKVVVSDSGIGLLETLKPKLSLHSVSHMEDAELIRLLFRGDLAWSSDGKGQGLQGCARSALKHNGSVDVRLTRCSVHLTSVQSGYETAKVRYQQDLISLKGTHICFSFPLDTPQ